MAIAIRMHQRGVIEATLLDGVTGGTNDGEWIECSGMRAFDLATVGITNATVQLRVSYEPDRPANSTHGLQAGNDQTADGIINVVDLYPHWIKARVSAYVSGIITARLRGTYV